MPQFGRGTDGHADDQVAAHNERLWIVRRQAQN